MRITKQQYEKLYNDYKKYYEDTNKECNELQSQLDSRRSLLFMESSMYVQLQSQLQFYQNLVELHQVYSRSKKTDADEALKLENISLKEELSSLTEKVNELLSKNDQLQSENIYIASQNKVLSEESFRNMPSEGLKKELLEARTQIEISRKLEHKANKIAKDALLENEQLNEQLKSEQGYTSIAEDNEVVHNLKNELSASQVEINILNAKNKALLNDIKKMEKDYETLKTKKNQALEETTTKLKELEEQIRIQKYWNRWLQTDFDKRIHEKEKLERTQRYHSSKIKRLEKSKQALEEKISELEKNSNSQSEKVLDELNNQIKDKDNVIQLYKTQIQQKYANVGRKPKFTATEIEIIKSEYEKGSNYRELAKKFNCSLGLLSKILKARAA